MREKTSVEAAIIQPTPERAQHDPVGLYRVRGFEFDKDGKTVEVETIKDEFRQISSPFYVTSTIPLLYERKSINKAQVQAAFAYMDDFDTGKMHPLCAAPLEIRGKGKEEFSNAVIRARQRLWEARKALDIGTAVERSAWAVLGMRWNLKEWTEREGFQFSEQTAKRLLVAALIGLAEHYGYDRRK